VWTWKTTLIARGSKGTVEAWDLRSGRRLWSRAMAYPKVPRDPLVEPFEPYVGAVGDDGVVCVLAGATSAVSVAPFDLRCHEVPAECRAARAGFRNTS
jgi:hypothetical protein